LLEYVAQFVAKPTVGICLADNLLGSPRVRAG
jgi:hypothetical protein